MIDMKYKKFSFRHAEEIFTVDDDFTYLWKEVKDVLDSITDEDIIMEFIVKKERQRVFQKQ